MNRAEAKHLGEVATGFSEGKRVQRAEFNKWIDDPNPSFHPKDQWRLKPEPYEEWVVINVDHGSRISAWSNAIAAATACNNIQEQYPEAEYTVKHLREVME